jgi:hypothetical protein
LGRPSTEPFESGLVKVLRVEAIGTTFTLPSPRFRRVQLAKNEAAGGPERAVPLAVCVGGCAATGNAQLPTRTS